MICRERPAVRKVVCAQLVEADMVIANGPAALTITLAATRPHCSRSARQGWSPKPAVRSSCSPRQEIKRDQFECTPVDGQVGIDPFKPRAKMGRAFAYSANQMNRPAFLRKAERRLGVVSCWPISRKCYEKAPHACQQVIWFANRTDRLYPGPIMALSQYLDNCPLWTSVEFPAIGT